MVLVITGIHFKQVTRVVCSSTHHVAILRSTPSNTQMYRQTLPGNRHFRMDVRMGKSQRFFPASHIWLPRDSATQVISYHFIPCHFLRSKKDQTGCRFQRQSRAPWSLLAPSPSGINLRYWDKKKYGPLENYGKLERTETLSNSDIGWKFNLNKSRPSRLGSHILPGNGRLVWVETEVHFPPIKHSHGKSGINDFPMKKPALIEIFHCHIHTGWWFQPLCKIWVRQLGLFFLYGKS